MGADQRCLVITIFGKFSFPISIEKKMNKRKTDGQKEQRKTDKKKKRRKEEKKNRQKEEKTKRKIYKKKKRQSVLIIGNVCSFICSLVRLIVRNTFFCK